MKTLQPTTILLLAIVLMVGIVSLTTTRTQPTQEPTFAIECDTPYEVSRYCDLRKSGYSYDTLSFKVTCDTIFN